MTMPHLSSTSVIGATVGPAAAAFPWWGSILSYATGVNQWLVAIGGLVIIAMTIRKLYLEIKIAERRSQDPKGE